MLLHLEQGGKVSVASSKLTLVLQLVQEYLPIPGFSPVLGIKHTSFFIQFLFLEIVSFTKEEYSQLLL